MINEGLLGTIKVDVMPGNMDNGHNVGVKDQPPNQQE
jgi:hypothetical protein